MIIKVPGNPGDLVRISHRYYEDFIGKIRDEFLYNYETKALWLTIEQKKYAKAFQSIYIEPLGETESEVVIPDAKDYSCLPPAFCFKVFPRRFAAGEDAAVFASTLPAACSA